MRVRAGSASTGRALVGLAIVGALALIAAEATPAAPFQQELRRHVEFLASDALEGRLTGSPGAERAAAYIVERLEALGAEPLLDDYRMPFEFTAAGADLGTRVVVDGPDGEREFTGEAVEALAFSDSATASGAAVFAGYGLVVPEGRGYPYDSYLGLDVEGRIVVVLRYVPEDVEAEDRRILTEFSGLPYKAMQARQRGAAGLIVITGPRSPNAGETIPMSFDPAMRGAGIVAASAGAEVSDLLFAGLDRPLEEIQAELDTGNPHATGFDLPVEITIDARIERLRRRGFNILARIPATGTPAVDRPWVVLGAHYDHLGRGEAGSSLADADEARQVHNGADDNASGVAALLEVAERIAALEERRRHVLVAFWSGEELGTLGSSAFVADGPVPVDRIAAYVNFDMVGRVRDNRLVVQAVGSSPVWPGLIERSNVPVGFDLTLQDDPYLPTDSSPFNSAGVPTLSFFTGSHQEYHRPADDADRINYEGLDRVVRFGSLIARRLVGLDEAPEFVSVERTTPAMGDRDSVRAFTGTIPDYATEVEGLMLGGVIEGGPAEEAGLKRGDVIVEFAGQEITNIYDYTYTLDAVKVDVPVTVVYLRDGERHETTLTPRARR